MNEQTPLTIHMMTAVLERGDAIGNYVFSLTTILQSWGCRVHLYSDVPHNRYYLPHYHSSVYQPDGRDILWLHFSIYSDNVNWIGRSSDFIILDSHNVSPAALFSGYDPHMEQLCQQGELVLSTLANQVELAVVHTEYVREDLQRRGYTILRKLPLIVDTRRFTGRGSRIWEPLLSQLEYLVFIGRITPQKNLKVALQVFAEVHQRRPQSKFFLVGRMALPEYAAELEALTTELGISDAVVFTGMVTEPDVLTSFLQHARFALYLSVWESFCVPIIEALYFGTPVLGHNVPPIPETMGPGGVVLQGTPAEMAEQIDALWDDTERYATLQRHGRLHAQSFTDTALRKALLELFQDLAAWR